MRVDRYEEDIARLRHEIEARGGPPSHLGVSGLPGHGSAHTGPPPPQIGHGPSNLFGGIMANQGGQQPGLAPLPQEQQANQPQPQPGPPQHQMPQQPQALPQQGPYQGNYAHQSVVNGMSLLAWLPDFSREHAF